MKADPGRVVAMAIKRASVLASSQDFRRVLELWRQGERSERLTQKIIVLIKRLGVEHLKFFLGHGPVSRSMRKDLGEVINGLRVLLEDYLESSPPVLRGLETASREIPEIDLGASNRMLEDLCEVSCDVKNGSLLIEYSCVRSSLDFVITIRPRVQRGKRPGTSKVVMWGQLRDSSGTSSINQSLDNFFSTELVSSAAIDIFRKLVSFTMP